MSTFYYCYSLVFPKFIIDKSKALLIVGILSAFLIFACCRYLFEELIYPHWLGFRNYDDGTSFIYYTYDNLYYAVPYVVLAAAIFLFVHYIRNERIQLQLREAATQAELSFLKSQINPHFLYNSLNYLYSLALPNSERIAMAILNLADLMRYTLHESKDGLVSLKQEIDYIRSYIALFSMRYEPNFYVNMEVKIVDDARRIAPLLLIPFIENALKHGIIDHSKTPILILLTSDKNKLELKVENVKHHNRKDHSNGIGLINVRRRLELLYPDTHTLVILDDEEQFRILLSVNLN